LPYTLCFDPHWRLEQMASLATALTSVGVVFTDKLLYSLAHWMANNAKLEKGRMQVSHSLLLPWFGCLIKLVSLSPLWSILYYTWDEVHCKKREWQEEFGSHQVMGKEDKGTMEACKAMCSRGEWPPLMVTYDSRHGWYVFALSWIGFELTHWFIPYTFDLSKFLSPWKLAASWMWILLIFLSAMSLECYPTSWWSLHTFLLEMWQRLRRHILYNDLPRLRLDYFMLSTTTTGSWWRLEVR
jgi:hypothetical protein